MVGNQRLRDWPESPWPVGEKPVCTLLLQNLVPSLLIVHRPLMSWSNVFSPSVKCLVSGHYVQGTELSGSDVQGGDSLLPCPVCLSGGTHTKLGSMSPAFPGSLCTAPPLRLPVPVGTPARISRSGEPVPAYPPPSGEADPYPLSIQGEPGTRAPPLRPSTLLPPLPAPRTELRGHPLPSGCTSARAGSSRGALPPAPPPLRLHFRPGPGPSGGTSARAPSPQASLPPEPRPLGLGFRLRPLLSWQRPPSRPGRASARALAFSRLGRGLQGAEAAAWSAL